MNVRAVARRLERLEASLSSKPGEDPITRILPELTLPELRAFEQVIEDAASAGIDPDAALWSWADSVRDADTVRRWRQEIER